MFKVTCSCAIPKAKFRRVGDRGFSRRGCAISRGAVSTMQLSYANVFIKEVLWSRASECTSQGLASRMNTE